MLYKFMLQSITLLNGNKSNRETTDFNIVKGTKSIDWYD